MPDEWQARQVTPAILQVSSSKHNAKRITTRVRGPLHQSITAILTEEKREAKQFTKLTCVCVLQENIRSMTTPSQEPTKPLGKLSSPVKKN